MPAILIADLADSFRTAMRAEDRSPLTLQLYDRSIRFFCDHLARAGKTATLDELTRENIRAWLAELAERNEPSTVSTRFAYLRRFCNWLVDEGELERSPMKGLSPPAIPAKPVPVLTDEQLAALVHACSGRSFECRRDEALIRVLIDTGLRVSEVCRLRLDEVNVRDESAIVLGKGRKVRPVYFGAKTALSLDRYLRERRRHVHAGLEAFFLTQRGGMTPNGARERLRIRARQAGIEERMHPHRFRHTFAHDFLFAGGQERDLKRLAGWSSDVMLERYGASAADARAREATRRLRRGDRI